MTTSAAPTGVVVREAAIQQVPAASVRTTTSQLPKHHVPSGHSAAGSIGTTILALALVIGLVFLLGKLAKRMPGLGAATGGAQGLRIVATLPLSTKDRAVVIDVNGTQLLLGIGADGARLLHQLEQPLPIPEPKPAMSFSQVMSQLRKTP